MDANQILNCPMGPNDSGETIVAGYLRALLHSLWTNGEGFSGKRPFGNSGWQLDIEKALVENDIIGGDKEYGEAANRAELNKAVHMAIDALR